MHQFLLYAYAIYQEKQINISEIHVWFITCNKIVKIPITTEMILQGYGWFKNMIDKIGNENDFPPNTSNPFFCNNLCGVRSECKYVMQ